MPWCTEKVWRQKIRDIISWKLMSCTRWTCGIIKSWSYNSFEMFESIRNDSKATFNCSPSVLSLCFFFLILTLTCSINTLDCTILLSKQWMPLPTMLLLYRFWLTKICICCKPWPPKDEMHDIQITLLMMLMLLFFHPSSALHARHTCAIFELWGRPFYLSLFVCFFLSFFEAMKGIQFTQLCCHISFFWFIQFTTCFLSSRGRLLNSRKRQLFCLLIQQAVCCLFERWIPVGSSEAAVWEFCLSISLQILGAIWVEALRCQTVSCYMWIAASTTEKERFFASYHDWYWKVDTLQ